MTKSIYAKALCAAAAVAISATGFSASAQDRTVRTAVVNYADLDLATDDGRSTLNGRLKGAVRQVCGSYDSKSLVDAKDHNDCMKQAKASAQRASVTIMAAAAAGEPVETAMVISN